MPLKAVKLQGLILSPCVLLRVHKPPVIKIGGNGMDICEIVRRYMKEGSTLDEAIAKAENKLYGQFSEDMKARIRTEINFTRDLQIELADLKAMREAYR